MSKKAEARPEPDPFAGVFKWAFKRHQRHLDRWLVGIVLTPIAAALAYGYLINRLLRPTDSQAAIEYLVLAGVTAVFVVVAVLIYSVARGFYEQRNKLRAVVEEVADDWREKLSTEQAAHRATQEELRTEREKPVDAAHKQRLLVVSYGLSPRIADGQPCLYSDGRPTDATYVKRMFHSHFGELGKELDAWDFLIHRREEAHEQLMDRITSEVSFRMPGVPGSPWLPDSIIPAFEAHIRRCEYVANSPFPEPDIELRDLSEQFGVELWPISGGGFEMFRHGADTDAPMCRGDLRTLFLVVRDSDEFEALRVRWRDVQVAKAPLLAALRALENPEHIYGSCEACRPTP